MLHMDPLAFLLAHDATRRAALGATPWEQPAKTPRRRLRRPANRAGRIRS